ncbi:methyltransferase [Castellaniella sp.]|uniref:methyltransferase n=1 Tax=Castellaniella sp. TaxID=1955812 RepID=UPI002B002290|nr:methyltransferase [Castellaniella sp.]
MAKLTKAQTKAHNEAEAILTKDRLSDDERRFVFENWHEGANHNNGFAGAFFTPEGLAGDFSMDVGGGRIIDLCAGIGALAFHAIERSTYRTSISEMVCIEINPRYVEIGRKLVPDARWINADVMDWREWHTDELDDARFDYAISNPPFGKVRRSDDGPTYRGAEFEYHVIDIASRLANNGTFILPQMSSSFRYSGAPYYERMTSGRGVDFEKLTGFHMDAGVGVDTSFHRESWKDVSPLCEIVCIDFTEARQIESAPVEVAAPAIPVMARPAEQLAFF